MLDDEPLAESETDNAEHATDKHDLESVHERAMRRFDAIVQAVLIVSVLALMRELVRTTA